MVRETEYVPGETAEVWVQDRGGGKPRLRGTVVIEDLDPVLSRISSRSGANGPQSPITQYILSEAANHLAERLTEDAPPGSDRVTVPRTLSGSLGHQPFIESVLNMSQHQMLRRWPLATDWYHDVIAYIMRPARFDQLNSTIMRDAVEEWSRHPLGEFIRLFTEYAHTMRDNPRILRTAEALQSLWPSYPPVRDAVLAYREEVNDLWAPFYSTVLETYDLRLRSGASMQHVAWAFNAIQSRETLERLCDPRMPTHIDDRGAVWTMTARSVLLLIAGAVTDDEGSFLTFEDLETRLPR